LLSFFKGTCTRGIYDNMKMAVETVFIGKDRQFNPRFLRMCGHYLIEPTACTPASGWGKGQVENQVGVVRERFFTPRLRVASYDELNAWLLDRCVAYAKAHKHPELTDCTIWQAFEAERPQLVQVTGPFDGFHATQASVSKSCLVRFDNNKYSVASRAVGRPVEIQAYADLIVIRQEGSIVGEHRRRFGRGETIYDPWHYAPVLAPAALRLHHEPSPIAPATTACDARDTLAHLGEPTAHPPLSSRPRPAAADGRCPTLSPTVRHNKRDLRN
jgi:hypothetical protein